MTPEEIEQAILDIFKAQRATNLPMPVITSDLLIQKISAIEIREALVRLVNNGTLSMDGRGGITLNQEKKDG
jgi:hypothetical protein